MLTLEIEGKFFKAPELWSEITHARFIQVNEYHEKIFPKHLEKELKDYTQDDELDFIRYAKEFIVFFFEIPKSLGDELRVNGDNSILDAYWLAHKFLSFPESHPTISSFKFKGKKYSCQKDDIKYIAENPTAGMKWQEYEQATTIINNFKALQDGGLKPLAMLTACLFRNGKYNQKAVEQAAKDFEDLTMDRIWGAYFFLNECSHTSLKNTVRSLKAKAAEASS